MSKLTKTLLVLAIAGLLLGFIFVSGVVNVERVNALYVALPFGAIFFGLFLISKMLEKEIAAHDEEQKELLAAANKHAVEEDSSGQSEGRRRTERSTRPGELVGAKAG